VISPAELQEESELMEEHGLIEGAVDIEPTLEHLRTLD
jgi:hypothetical protein